MLTPASSPHPSLQTYVTVADDLRICTVKYAEDLERRFCFEVVTPNKSCMLQADSDAQRKKWVAYLEAGVARALRISISAKVGDQEYVGFPWVGYDAPLFGGGGGGREGGMCYTCFMAGMVGAH